MHLWLLVCLQVMTSASCYCECCKWCLVISLLDCMNNIVVKGLYESDIVVVHIKDLHMQRRSTKQHNCYSTAIRCPPWMHPHDTTFIVSTELLLQYYQCDGEFKMPHIHHLTYISHAGYSTLEHALFVHFFGIERWKYCTWLVWHRYVTIIWSRIITANLQYHCKWVHLFCK